MQKGISSSTFRKMIIAGAKAIEDNKSLVDSLNVFPVPDGDTGTNMSLTINSAVKEVNNCYENSFTALSDALSRGALRGARGNSGVILSQILKGMAMEIAKTENEVTTKTLAKALQTGAEIAYKAVTKPKEGTILTVIRVMAEFAVKLSKKESDVEAFFEHVLNEGENALQQTPELLPVLKKAGVVDAGGRGLLVIFAGMQKIILGEEDFIINVEEMNNKAQVINGQVHEDNHDFLADIEHLGDIEFGYCTEFMVTHMKKKTTESDIDKLREKLVELGDSVVCVGDLELVKVHVHTNEPNLAFQYGLELGELINMKIDNMREQNREIKKQRHLEEDSIKDFGIVAVAPGDGIANVFKDIMVDNIIEGGQTMNPSANDIAKACESVSAKNIFVLPNNKNIILAAEQAKDLTKKLLHVIPTRSVAEGIAAALAFNGEESLEGNITTMTTAKSNIISASVTHAVRKTSINGFNLNEGDIIGLDENAILTKGVDVNKTTLDLIAKLKTDNVVNITLFYGKDITSDQAQELQSKLEQKYPDCDIILIDGGQPVYYYILSLE